MNEILMYRDMLAAGLTLRRLDYWTKQGYLRAVDTSPGYGSKRRWPAAERDIARMMIRLNAAGLSVDVAAKVARESVESGQNQADLGGGLLITWDAVA